MVGYYGITLAVHVSIHLSYVHPYFRFWAIILVNVSGFSPNSVCTLILWRSGLGLLMGKFRQFLTELHLSAWDMSVFSFPDYNVSKYQWIFTKLGVCIDIVETCFGIANGQISSIFDRVICQQYVRIFRTITRVNLNGFSPNLICAFTVKLQWLEHLWHHGNLFKTWVVRATEG